MIPLLLLVLLSPFALQATKECDDNATCLFISTCLDDSRLVANLTTTQPKVKAHSHLSAAFEDKRICGGHGFISRLSMVSTSISTMNISFVTNLPDVGFEFGMPTGPTFFEFRSKGRLTAKLNHTALALHQSNSTESLGRVTYSIRVESEHESKLLPLFEQPISFIVGGKRFALTPKNFLAELRRKFACDPSLVHDICHDADCVKSIFTARSVSCAPGYQLQLKSGGVWINSAGLSCPEIEWTAHFTDEILKTVLKTVKKLDPQISIICKKTEPNTVAPSTHTHSESEEPVKDPSVIAPVSEKPPITTGNSTAERKEEKGGKLPGSKWAWIGGSGALILLVSVLSIFGCLVCRRKRQAKANKLSKGSKKEVKSSQSKTGGKTSSSNQPSTSDSKGEAAARPLNAPNSNNPMPSSDDGGLTVKLAGGSGSGDAVTEMNLDVLKTEKIN